MIHGVILAFFLMLKSLGEAYLGTSALASSGLLITIWLVGFFICLSDKNISFNI
jgi:hypothetical protein